MDRLKNIFQSQKILVIILSCLLVVNTILLAVLFLRPAVSVTIKNTSPTYKLLYTPTKGFSEFMARNNTAAVKQNIPKKNRIEIVVRDEAIKSSLSNIIGVYPILGEIDEAKSVNGTIVINLKVDPARLKGLSQPEIDNYVQEFIISPLYFQSHPKDPIKQKSDSVHAYLEKLKKARHSFTLIKQ